MAPPTINSTAGAERSVHKFIDEYDDEKLLDIVRRGDSSKVGDEHVEGSEDWRIDNQGHYKSGIVNIQVQQNDGSKFKLKASKTVWRPSFTVAAAFVDTTGLLPKGIPVEASVIKQKLHETVSCTPKDWQNFNSDFLKLRPTTVWTGQPGYKSIGPQGPAPTKKK